MKRIIFFILCTSVLEATGISMPKNHNPVVENEKEIDRAQKLFKKMCLNPSKSQLKSLKLVKRNTLCSVSSLPSEEGCRDITNCYISKYRRSGFYKFHLDDTDLVDLSPLEFFLSPTRFVLNNNKISNLTSLSKLNNIESLSLTDNPIKDISSLKNLNLQELRINNTPLRDISPLVNINTIDVLSIGNNIEDIEPLKYLKKLRLLNISSKNTIDICHIKNLENLDNLSIKGGNVSNIDCLKNLSKLTFLILEDMPLKDVSVIKNFKKLKFLHLTNVPVENIDAIESLKEFSSVSLINTKIKDLSVLTKMSNNNQRIYLSRTSFHGNKELLRCSPKSNDDITEGKSCYEKNGMLKPLWKRWLGF